MTSKVLVITGGPGVDKTTIVRGILRILAAKGVRLLLCAPTGRAAKRMVEATGFEARTIRVYVLLLTFNQIFPPPTTRRGFAPSDASPPRLARDHRRLRPLPRECF